MTLSKDAGDTDDAILGRGLSGLVVFVSLWLFTGSLILVFGKVIRRLARVVQTSWFTTVDLRLWDEGHTKAEKVPKKVKPHDGQRYAYTSPLGE